MTDHFNDCVCNLCKGKPDHPPHVIGCMCIVCLAVRDAEARRAFWSDHAVSDKDVFDVWPAGPEIIVPAPLDPDAEVSVTLLRRQWQLIMWACRQESAHYEEATAILDQVGCDHEWVTVERTYRSFERCEHCGLTR